MEERLYKILGDGQAYSDDELYEKIAVAHQDYLKEGIRRYEDLRTDDFQLFKTALFGMLEDNVIISNYINGKEYYLRIEFI